MSGQFIDLGHPAYDATFPKPRGILPIPPAVAELIAREEARVQKQHGVKLTDEARRKMLNDQTLDWFYRDQWVSYRETDQGVEILAVGPEEIEQLKGRLSGEEQQTIRTRQV
jgi:hypothetical protein